MPIALGVAVELIGALIFALMGVKLSQALVRPFDIHVPVVGRIFHGVVNAIESAMVAGWNAILRPYVRSAVNFFKAVADVIILLPTALVLFGAATVEALDYLRHTAIHAIVSTALGPYTRAINALNTAEIALGNRVTGIDHRLGQSIDDLRDFVHTEVLARLLRGIDRLRSDVYDTAIPALRHIIHAGDIALEDSIGVVRGEVKAAERELHDLAKRLDIPVSLLESLIAAVGITAALEALQTLARCEGKLRTLCLHDPGAWSDFLLGVLAILAFPGLREMTKMAASLVDEISGAIREVADS